MIAAMDRSRRLTRRLAAGSGRVLHSERANFRPHRSAVARVAAGQTRRILPAVAAVFATLLALTACATSARESGSARWNPAGSGSAATPESTPLPPVPSSAVSAPASRPPTAASTPTVPPGVTAAIAVFDRKTGSYTERYNPTMRFRSASLVKLLIALDYLWDLGPDYAIPAADRSRLDLMLRSSDDNAATYFYKRGGFESVVNRMVARLALQNTTPPSAPRTGWGSTAVSAADIVRIYRYILDTAPAPVRDYVMANLRQSTRCATDGFDQSFGIPTVFARPWAVKQGWYEFGGTPTRGCTTNAVAAGDAVIAPVAAPAGNAVDWTGEVLHTTGTVGAGDRTIVVVLTVHRHGTPFASASAALTRLTGSLRLTETG
jgi:hypothetical protein